MFLFAFYLFFSTFTYLCVCVHVHTHGHAVRVAGWGGGGKRNFREPVFSFRCLGSGDQTQDSGRQTCRQVA